MSWNTRFSTQRYFLFSVVVIERRYLSSDGVGTLVVKSTRFLCAI